MKRVLILGAGLVAKPVIEYLLENGIRITVASPMKERADEMINCHPLGESLHWTMDDKETLDRLVSHHDISVSLLPYIFHTEVAKICIKYRKHLVTTSYVQPAMRELENAAKEADIILLNEIGLDPGIDHMSAMKIIDSVHSRHGKIDEFWSICGALPAPEAADNPMKYRFSWSPGGVILASRNGASYLKEGKMVEIEPVNLFKDRFEMEFPGVGALEVYPNRDSVSYREVYGIPEVKTMYRGTFRHKGWCETLDVMKHLGMLDDMGADYTGYTANRFLAERAGTGDSIDKNQLAARLGIPASSTAVESLAWLGFFGNEKIREELKTPFDITADTMISRMELGNSQRDMVALMHIFRVTWPDRTREKITSSLLDFGSPATNTSIARTVALPAAIAVKLLLEKKISLTGIYRPVVKEIYEPVLAELLQLGIEMKEEFGLPV